MSLLPSASATIVVVSCVICLLGLRCHAAQFEITEEQEFLNLVEHERLVVTLLAPEGVEPSALESTLLAIREDLVDTLGAWVVKIHATQNIRNHFGLAPLSTSDDGQPFIAYFRNGVPTIYDGSATDDDAMFVSFTSKASVCSRTLNDVNFEHLTQASTGATTGDWLIYFYRPSQPLAEQKLVATRVETLACRINQHINVAAMHRDASGAATGRRFGVTQTPAFIFIRHGKVHRMQLADNQPLTVDALVTFVQSGYKTVAAEDVPELKSAVQDAIESVVDWGRSLARRVAERDATTLSYVGGGGVLALVVLSAIVYATCCSSGTSSSNRSKRSRRSKAKKS